MGAALALALVPVAPATAQNVVADDQVVQGTQCVGAACVPGDSSFFAPPLMVKTDDSPAIRFIQTDASWPAQEWHLAGNEANFFLREPGNSNALPFRVQSGAPRDGIWLRHTGAVTTVGTVEQELGSSDVQETGPADESAILDSLRSLPISEYTAIADSAAEPHLAPLGTAFHTAFGLGGDESRVAPADMAGVALSAVKALDARVTDISLTPGPGGPVGAPGPRGPVGPPGAGGSVPQDVTEDLDRANKRIRALARARRKQAKLLRKTRKQVRRLLAAR